MESVFSLENLMNKPITAGFDTETTRIPQGEYIGSVATGENALRTQMSKTDRPMLVVRITTTDEEAVKATGIDEPGASYFILLDLDENGDLEHGANKNIRLGQLLDALGMNTGNADLSQLQGNGPLKFRVDENGFVDSVGKVE